MLKAYRTWTRQLQSYTKSKDYQNLCQQDVIDFLTWLAVERNVYRLFFKTYRIIFEW